jgi:hypothetical protein
MNLSPLPVQKFFDSNGKPLVSGRLFTYVSGTSTKLATYKDQAGTLNTNPIVLDYRGEANVWLDPSLTYKFVLAPAGIDDPPTSTIWTVDNISAALTFASLTQQILGAILYPQSSAELAAGVTPVQYWFPWGIVDRYKANTNPGTTDMTSAFTIALSCNNVVSAPYGPYRSLTGPIAITGNRSCSGAVGGDVGAQPTSIIHDPASTGPLFTLISTEFGSAYLGHFDITGGNGTAAVLTARPQTTIEYLHIEPTGGYNGHGIVSLGGLKLTAALIAGATSATLADKWVAYTAVYSVTFSNGDVRNVTLTNGATTMTWSGGLSAGATDSPIFAQGSWDLTIRSCKVVGPNVAGVMSPNAFRGFIVNVNGGVVALEHNLAALVSVACELVQGQNITLYRNDFNSCGLNASDSFADGQCGIRAMSHNYKLNINVFAQWIEGSPTSINLDNLNGFSIFASFINDLGASNTPAIAIGAAALNVKVDTTFVEVKNTNANVACVSNAADGTILVNNTWNPSNTGGGALAHGIINTANCLEYGNKFMTTPTTPIIDTNGLLFNTFPVTAAFPTAPTIGGAGTAGVQTYSAQVGYYERIGRRVSYDIFITLTAKDAATAGNLTIFNLPFTTRNNAASGRIYSAAVGEYSNIDLTSGGATPGRPQLCATAANNGTSITLFVSGTGVASAVLTAAALTATSSIRLSIAVDI